MALSRAEIELLIKARSEADQTFQRLSNQIKAVTGESAKASTGLEQVGQKTRSASAGATAAGVAFGLLAERLGRGLVSAFQSSVQAANQLDSGLIGLRSVANAFKQDAGAAEDAAKRLAADGLMSVGEAASGLKNLLAAGFGLPESVTLLERFKDSAAFGRQSALDFGQAVTSATEGIKNGNSILVDNAGVTKNLSQILVEAGFSAQDLSRASSDVNVRMALFNGILKETTPQLGDAARYLETAAGKQAKFNAEVTTAQQQIGKALQPALAATLQTLTPFVQAVGASADVLVPLGFAVGGVVAPLAAMRAASALGITSLGSLGSTMASTLSVFQGVRTFGDARAGLQLVGEAAGLTTAALGPLGTAAAVAGAAFVGWQLGRAIDELTGLSGAVERATVRLFGLSDAAQVAGAKQDVIDRAVRNGAASTITYAQAIEYNNRVEAIRISQYDKGAEAQRRRVDAELALGRITLEQANAQRAAIAADETAAGVRQRRISFADALSASEKKFRDEITATGISQRELEQTLRTNEVAFDAWAKTVGLSDDTVKRLKDSIKTKNGVVKDGEQRAREAAAAEKALRDELEQTAGVLTQRGLNDQLKRLEELLAAAAAQGSTALTTATRNLITQFEDLRAKALASGLSVDALDAAFKRAATSSGVLLEGVRTFSGQYPGFMQPVTEANGDLVDQAHDAIQAQQDLTAAYQLFGLRTPQELQRVAAEAQRNYEILRASGTATTDQLKVAYERMIEDQRAATGRLPTIWDQVASRIRSTMGQLYGDLTSNLSFTIFGMGQDIDGSLRRTAEESRRMYYQMVADGTSTPEQIAAAFKKMQEDIDRSQVTFGERMTDVWVRIKESIFRVFDDILRAFTQRLIGGLLGSLAGQQGAFSSAFAGFLGGGGGPGGGGGLFGSLLGSVGGGAPLNSAAIAQAGLGLPGVGAGAGAGAGAGLLGGILGGAGAGAAGLGLGLLGQRLFGGTGFGSGAFGAGSGAATGALIGSIVPGLGTGIGALIGGGFGLLGGLLGRSQGQKANDIRDEFFAAFGTAGTGAGSGFNNVAAQLARLSPQEGGGEGGGRLFQDLIRANTVQELERAINAVIAALERQQAAGEEAGDATQEGAEDSTSAYEDSVRVVDALQERQRALADEIDRTAAAGGDTTELNKMMADLQRQIEAAEEESRRLNTGIDRTIDAEGGVADLSRGFYGLWRDIERAGEAASDLSNTLRGMPGTPVGTRSSEVPTVEGGAAEGIYARRPGLVLFGEGGEPEVGGPRSFFKDVFAELGVGTRGAASAGGSLTLAPILIVPTDRAGGVDGAAINRHLASVAGVGGNDNGLREMLENLIRNVVRQELSRG